MKKQPIPEDFELSDDEPATVNLNEEQKLSSKFITFDCPPCQEKLQFRNEIEINPKGIKCSCNPCSFKLTKNDKTMNVSRDDNGDIKLDSEDHSISFSWNRQITPEDKKVESTNKMISDVMSTPRSSSKQQIAINDMDWKYFPIQCSKEYSRLMRSTSYKKESKFNVYVSMSFEEKVEELITFGNQEQTEEL